MYKTLIAILALSLVSGCTLTQTKPDPVVTVVTEQVPMEIYQPPLPSEIRLEDVRWFVITPENFESQVAELERLQGGEWVVFAITPRDYENMAYNLQELRRYIREQKEIILYYRKATEADQDLDTWLERNRELQQKLQQPES